MQKGKKHLLIILFLGFFLRAITAIYFQSQSAALGYIGYDESVYLSLARHMTVSSPFSYTLKDTALYFQDYRIWYIENPLFHHPPLFVWLLLLWQTIIGPEVFASRFLNVILGTAIVYVTFLIGSRISERTGLFSALFIALSSLNIQNSAFVLMDTLLALLTGLFILYTIKLSEEENQVNTLLTGFFLGLTMWTKYLGAIAITFLAVYCFYKKMSQSLANRVIGFSFILFAPWLIWNYSVYGSTAPIETVRFLMSWRQIELPLYAYVVFLPLIMPFALLGIIGLLKTKNNVLKLGLSAFIITFLLVLSLIKGKEMRYLLPIISPLSILAADFIDSIDERYKNLILAITIFATLIADYIVLGGGYFWYLPFWHYQSLASALSLGG